jgi:hypothetical protein
MLGSACRSRDLLPVKSRGPVTEPNGAPLYRVKRSLYLRRTIRFVEEKFPVFKRMR